MSDEFDPERARLFSLQCIDVTASTVIANRNKLAKEVIERHPEYAAPEFGVAAVNLALSVLAILRVHVETDDDLADARLVPPEGSKH